MISKTLLAATALLPTAAIADAVPPDDTIVVTATRSGDGVPASLLGASVTVLDAAVLDFRQTRVVSDILRDVPGVAVSRIGAVGNQTQVRIRGSEGNHVLVLIDGIEVSDPFQGEYDFANLLADDGARVEVLRGQQSALYGSDAIGGVIQYLTASGRSAPGYSARLEGGSFGTVAGAARAAGVAGGIDYAVTGSYLRADGTPTARGGLRDVGAESGTGSAKASFAPAPNVTLSAVVRYAQTSADFNTSQADPTAANYGQIIDSPGLRSRSAALYGLVRGEVALLDDRWTTSVSVQAADSRLDSFRDAARTSGDSGDRVKGSAVSTFRFGSGQIKQRATIALDLERESFRNRDPSGFAFGGRRHVTNTGIVGQYDLTVDDALALGGAVRRDLNSQFADTTTYRVQASYVFAQGTKLHAAGGSGVKNPGFFELYGFSDGRYIGNPGLKPERSEGFEVGAEQALFGGAARGGVTYFDNRLHDEIVVRFVPPTFAGTPQNLASVSKQSGVEAFVTSRIGERIRVDASYTHLRARQGGVEEVRRAPDIASLNVTYEVPRGLGSVTGTVRYNGRQKDVTFTDPTFATTPIVTLGSYTLVNIAAEAKLTRALSAFGRVENFLGERYEEVFSYRAPGRAAYGGIRARF